MPTADDDGGGGAEEVNGDKQVNGVSSGTPEVTQTKTNMHAPKSEPPVADEFGLPVKPPRRRGGDEDVQQEAHEAETNRPRAATLDDIADRPKAAPASAQHSRHTSKQTNNHQHSRHSSRLSNPSRPGTSAGPPVVSESSHQALAPQLQEEVAPPDAPEEESWQSMPALATHRIYDDWGKVLANAYDETEDEQHLGYSTLGGAGKGYTRVQVDEDAQSATSMDENTAYLFKGEGQNTNTLLEDNEDEGRDVLSQMQATKEFLTEGQRIAYVGVVRLSIGQMLDAMAKYEKTKATRKPVEFAIESSRMWGQRVMGRCYQHMDLSSEEQVMVEQLAEHGVRTEDLVPALMRNARVRDPRGANGNKDDASLPSARPEMSSPRPSNGGMERTGSSQKLNSVPSTPGPSATPPPPPAYESVRPSVDSPRPSEGTEPSQEVSSPPPAPSTEDPPTYAIDEPPSYTPSTDSKQTLTPDSKQSSSRSPPASLDIDLRWTILCDLFLLLLASGSYDSRSRTLLERVSAALIIPWQETARFEKRVTDALEMQEAAEKENWNEDEHLSNRKKAARNKRLMVMGLCTVGGGLVIGLSAGLLAPVIGSGLALGFGAIGVAGTETFLAGAGAAALIGSGGALTGSVIGVRASNRRTGAVRTYEYRPLFNNKRTNLIVTVSGWMTGKVDDVRLPFSTVDPVMGDLYSVNWEPEMLQSTGQTIQILATEALTQTIQQILGFTALTTLMAGLSTPIVLAKLSYLIDNPWTVSCARADATGLILADSLVDRNLGVRPITLVGFSLGSRVIFSCLKELAARGAVGLVQNVYLFGSPVLARREDYIRARTVVSGRFVNGYATNDWILGYLFRATTGGVRRVSGLAPVEVEGVENMDCTSLVPGHMAYRGKMPVLLDACGWVVDGLEFSEIEDPDPEDHVKRQRELINEIEAARHVLDAGGKVRKKEGRFAAMFSGFGGKKEKEGKARKKAGWETYDERSQHQQLDHQKVLEGEAGVGDAGMANVMFDVDAIRTEALRLALEEGSDLEEIKGHLQIREIESTMPALKLDSPGPSLPSTPEMRQTRSYDESTLGRTTNGVAVNGHAGPSKPRPSYEVNGYGHANGDAGRVSLSFEPARTPSAHPSPTPSPDPARSSPQPGKPDRPPLKTAATAPNSVQSVATSQQNRNPNHNPWAEEEEEMRMEREVEMSFE